MTHVEFLQLRELPGKTVQGDLLLAPGKNSDPSGPCDLVGQASVENTLKVPLKVFVRFTPDIPSVVFTFHQGGSLSAICRLCVNGIDHEDCGRTHKHEMRNERDLRKNLPFAKARPNFASASTDPRAVWAALCQEASITHVGKLLLPGEV